MILLLGSNAPVWAQTLPTFCTAATDQGTLTFTTAFQNTATLATGTSYFWRVYAIAGRTYSFSTCGMTSDDTYLRVYDGASNIVAFRDDTGPYCTGTAASIDWTVATSGVYFVHLSQFNCNPLGSATSMAYKASSIATGIISVAPTPGGLGQSITITGTGLSSPTALTINGANALANIVSNNGNVLVVRVPATATASGNVSITTANGTATNAFTLMPPPGNALAFDGSNDYVSLLNRTSYSNISTAITLEAWVRTSNSGEQYITTKDNDSWYLAVNGGGTGAGKATFYLNGVSASSGGWLAGSTTISDGRWHHVAGTYDGTTLKLYVDGVVDASRTVTATIQNGGASPVYVGSRATSLYWNGSIDEFRVYNTALTQANILADMRSVTSAVPASQVLYLNFDQGTPATASTGANTAYTTLYDLVSAAPATLNNFALTSGSTTSNYVESYAVVVPTATAATAQTTTSFTANWTAPAVGTVDNSYRLDVATNAAFTTGLTTTTVSGLSQAVTGLTPGTTYYYRVRADKTSVSGQGAPSNTITVCGLPVAAAQNVAVSLNASGSATVTAAAVNNGSTGGCGNLTLGLQKIVSGQITEGGSLTLTAPAGQVFTAVTFASYGTPTLNANGTYTTSSCHSATSQAQVESYLLGQNTATIPANNNVFGDPCVGTVKALAVQAVYGPALAQLTYTCAEIGANLVLLSATDANGNTSRTTATVTVQDNSAPAAAGSGPLPAAPVLATRNVPEAGNYGILYQLDVPNAANFNSLTAVPYTVNNSGAAIANPARVAYFMELNNGTTTKWVWASMNNFATSLTQLGLPNPTANNVNLHQSVTGLNVFASAGAGVTTGTSLGTGRIEMWYWNYTQGNVDNVPGASGSTYDFGDESNVGSGSYGSFQVHNVTAGQTVLAYNNWGGSGSGNSDIGIGNQPSGHPDWTFTNNTSGFTVKRIYILVPNGGAFTQSATVALNASGSATVANTQVYTGATDNCGVSSVVVTPNTFSCAQAGTTQLVTVAVADASGNTATQSALVTVQDNLAPTVVTQAVSASVGTNGRVYVAPSAVNNGSTDNCAITNLALSASSFGACAASAALSLDGTDDYVSLPSGLTSSATNFTFEGWVNYTDNGYWTRVFDFGSGTNVYMLLTPKANWDAASANHLAFAISTGSSAAEQRIISNVTMPTGWHHLAVTLSKTGTVVTGTLYLDGSVIGTNAAMTLTPADLGTLTQTWLGRSQFGQDPFYKGLLDEVRVWSTARTAAEINLYKDKSLAGNTTGLLAYYDFNDAPTSATVADRTAAARTGTLNNFTQALAFQAPGQVPALGLGANTVTLTASDIFGNVSSTTATVTVTVPTPTVATWNGSLSNEWADCRNWQYNTLPSATTDVTIPMVGTAQYPTLSSGIGTAKNLNLASGTSLTVASGAELQVNGNWMNNGGTTTMSGTVTFTGSAAIQTLGGTTGTPFNTLVVNKASGTVQLAQNLTVNTALTMTSGTLTTTSSYQVNMGGMATISESDANYVIGTVAMSRTLVAGTAQSYGGLGLTLTPAAGSTSPGSTLVLRTTGTALSGAGSSRSVLRYFDIRPATNTGLNVAMSFNYFAHELNGIPTANLRMFKSASISGPWAQQSGTTAGTNVVTKTGLTSLSILTLGSSTNPLPVELTTFTAQAEGPAVVRLDWTTASEKNSDRFEVERSTNGYSFDRIGTVAAVGTASTPTTYALTDAKLPAGASLLYYRLRQIDLDGTATYSPVRNVQLAAKAGLLTLVPNPARATTLAGAVAGAPVEVFDALGRVVLKATADANGTAALSLPDYLSTGVYVVRSGTQTVRLIVE